MKGLNFGLLFGEQLKGGVTPHALALSAGFAFTLGVNPFLGTTTGLCFVFALLFRLNQPLIQALNYLVFPLQLICIPIFLHIGESVLSVPHLTLDVKQLPLQFVSDWRSFLSAYGMAGLHALLAWALLAPAGGAIIYSALRLFLERMKRRII